MGKKRSSASKGSEDDYDPDSPTLLEEVLHYKSKTRRLFSPSSTSDSSASIQSYGSIKSSGSSSGNGSVDLDELIKAAARPSSSSSGSSASRILRSLEGSSEDELDPEASEAPGAGVKTALEPASPASYSTVSSC